MNALLATYLNDHLAGATGGLELFRRSARAQHSPELERLAAEIGEDRQSLLGILRALDVPVDRVKVAGGWVGEKVMRLKPNGSLLRRSPLDALVELESMTVGVHGKASGWRTLRALADTEPGLDAAELDRLLARAERQLAELEQLRVAAAGTALR